MKFTNEFSLTAEGNNKYSLRSQGQFLKEWRRLTQTLTYSSLPSGQGQWCCYLGILVLNVSVQLTQQTQLFSLPSSQHKVHLKNDKKLSKESPFPTSECPHYTRTPNTQLLYVSSHNVGQPNAGTLPNTPYLSSLLDMLFFLS